MKAAKSDTRPNFRLMKQTDIVSFFHLQMPRWLFSHASYKSLSLETKVAYTFLLNRFQLSRLNGWVNNDGEVFVIFTRESLAEEMQITYKKAISSFKELVAAKLIWEKRVGRGNANQIYLALVELPIVSPDKHTAAPFGNEGARPDETAHLDADMQTNANFRPAETAHQEVPEADIKTCQYSSSRPAETAHEDLPKQHPSKKEESNNDINDTKKVYPSVTAQENITDRIDIEESNALDQLLENCELWVLPEESQNAFRNAIERLYYSEYFTIGKAKLPQARVRAQLWQIDGMVLQDAYSKLRANTERKVKNSTAYLMSTLFNAIHEGESDLLVDPFLNSFLCYSPQSTERGNPPCT